MLFETDQRVMVNRNGVQTRTPLQTIIQPAKPPIVKYNGVLYKPVNNNAVYIKKNVTLPYQVTQKKVPAINYTQAKKPVAFVKPIPKPPFAVYKKPVSFVRPVIKPGYSVYKKPLTPTRVLIPNTATAKPVLKKVYSRLIPKKAPYSFKSAPLSRHAYRGPLVVRRGLQIPGRRILYPSRATAMADVNVPTAVGANIPAVYNTQAAPQSRYVPGYGYFIPAVSPVVVQEPVQTITPSAPAAVAPTSAPAQPCHTCGKKRSGCTTISGFAFSSAHLPVAHQQLIKQVALKILNQSVNAVILTGHTDASGKENYNQILGARRAGAVMRALKKELAVLKPGAAKELFWKIRSRGEKQPVSKTNAAANRRVHICLKKASF